MTNKIKTLQTYKENPEKSIEQSSKTLRTSEQLKKEFKKKLFREIIKTQENQASKKEYLEEKNSDKKKESRESESFESLMWREKETFKVNSIGWKEITRKDEYWNNIKIKKSPKGDIFEYLDWSAKGKQIFRNYKLFLKYVAKNLKCTPEKVKSTYLMTSEQFEKRMQTIEESEGGYKAFFNKEIDWCLTGYYVDDEYTTEKFYGIESSLDICLSDGYYVRFDKNTWYLYENNNKDDEEFIDSFSGRLLKDHK